MAEAKPTPTIQTSPVNHKQPPVLWTRHKCCIFVSVVAFINVILWFGHARIGKGWAFWGKFGLIFASCIAFDSLADTWLDRVRLGMLDSRYMQRHRYDCQSNMSTYSKLWEAHQQRKAYYHQKRDTLASSRPWMGPNNWHYQTCDLIRDNMLSVVLASIYLWSDITAFKDWWIPLIWGKYMGDIFTYLLKQSVVEVSWLNFILPHHLGAGIFLAGASVWSTQTIPSVYLCIVLIWLSNMCMGVLLVYRICFGVDHHAAWLLSFVTQRLLRWGGTVWAVYGIIRSDDATMVIMFQAPYCVMWNIVCLLGIEILDISAQKKTLCRFLEKRKA